MRALAVLGAALILLSAAAGCAPRRNSEQVRIYEACVAQLDPAMSASASASGSDQDRTTGWGNLALGEPATVEEQCACHSDELYWVVRRDGKDALINFYEGAGPAALVNMTAMSRSAFGDLCT